MEAYVTKENIADKTGEWLERIAPFNTHEMALNRDRAALLVIDMQNFFLDPKSPTFTCGGSAILPNVKRLIAAFRRANRRRATPIIAIIEYSSPPTEPAE